MNAPQLRNEAQVCLQKLMRLWFEFERDLNRVPIIQRLEHGQFNLEDYQRLLLNLRQQVIEGARWITRCASSFDRHYADVRSIIIGHAQDEHRDYTLIEQDYVNAGGILQDIQNQERNAGSEALHAFMMYRASQTNPIDMVGAMWIIEGLGHKMASAWADRINELCEGDGNFTHFMAYHGVNDQDHMDKLYRLLDRVCQNEEDARRIIKTAKVVAKLYALQLEEIDHE